MKLVFQVGDVVYHPVNGKSTVEQVDTFDPVRPYRIATRDDYLWVRQSELSFSPWPAPNHTRLREEGWWIVTFKNNRNAYPRIRKVVGDQMFDEVGDDLTTKPEEYNFHKYIGKDWK